MKESGPLVQRFKAKRERIHLAAQTLFMRSGFEGASMDAIAEEAQVSKPTLYRYYQNKEALFVAVLERLALHEFSGDELLIFQRSPMNDMATLERALRTWMRVTLENIMQPTSLGLLRLLIAEQPRFPWLGALFFQAAPNKGGSCLVTLLESAHTCGIITFADREAAMRLFVGSLLTYVIGDGLLTADSVPRVPTSEQVEALVRVFLRAIT